MVGRQLVKGLRLLSALPWYRLRTQRAESSSASAVSCYECLHGIVLGGIAPQCADIDSSGRSTSSTCFVSPLEQLVLGLSTLPASRTGTWHPPEARHIARYRRAVRRWLGYSLRATPLDLLSKPTASSTWAIRSSD